MKRVVRPEILATLPPDDPRAQANRRDLRVLNRLLGNWRWSARMLRRWWRPGDQVLEAGAGEGDLGRYLCRHVPGLRAGGYTGQDLNRRPDDWPAGWSWHQGDLLEQEFVPPPRVLLINFLLHQFQDHELQRLGAAIRQIPLWIFCEPHRTRRALAGLALLRPFGLHDVSWSDGRTSIRAGFRGRELATLLGADAAERQCRIGVDIRGTYRLVSWDGRCRSGSSS